MKLTSILDKNLIFCDITGSSREEIYSNMLQRAAEHIELPCSSTQLVDDLIARENSASIPYEGMAIPHLRDVKLQDLHVLVAILKTPVQLKSNDIKPSKVIVMSLISETTTDIYLKSLAAFTRFCMSSKNLDTLACSLNSEAALKALEKVTLKKDITAEDVMTINFPTVTANDRLSDALDIMHLKAQSNLAVVDTENRLVGQLDAIDVLSSFVPDYLMRMDTLKFVSSFEMFDKIFKEERDLQVKGFIKPAQTVITSDTPLIQFTVVIAKREAETIFVVDSDKKLCGVISINNIVRRILRG